MIGGNLAVGEGDASVLVPKFKNYGFDLVFHQVDLNTGLDELEKYLKERN
jgi:methylaspartate mutase sigma subunit